MRLLCVFLVALAGVACEAAKATEADCGAGPSACRKPSCCRKQPCYAWCTVLMPCRTIEYEEQERTFYNTVYEEIMDKHTVEAVRYVEDTEHRCVPSTICQETVTPCPGAPACAPADGCGGAGCQGGCGACVQMVQERICRKVPYTVVRPERYEKVEERPRVVAKQVPYTVTVCIPHEVIKYVPVRVCRPVTCVCRECADSSAPGGCD